ncbi:hypothetical protein [Pseudooceanicola nitratireducens]|uniref:hypothetical protein n=1 Tax=Pseudooceanicola nitratireducens TaxID=517719 RepID=UPI001C98DFBE|nr:hypothetical protein [Pseudooceanicola nitratireducens]MBY6156629.1 hypothetical protein [Pseudooceanicola nitratireducens]
MTSEFAWGAANFPVVLPRFRSALQPRASVEIVYVYNHLATTTLDIKKLEPRGGNTQRLLCPETGRAAF